MGRPSDASFPPSEVSRTLIFSAVSKDGAQSTTLAFSGFGMMTGNLGAQSFFPPGKVADFWGFQYLRDNDPSEMGHAGDFLTSAAMNTLNNLIAQKRVPTMIAIWIANGGGDAQGHERGKEYDTMSGMYADYIEVEVLPREVAASGAPTVRRAQQKSPPRWEGFGSAARGRLT